MLALIGYLPGLTIIVSLVGNINNPVLHFYEVIELKYGYICTVTIINMNVSFLSFKPCLFSKLYPDSVGNHINTNNITVINLLGVICG